MGVRRRAIWILLVGLAILGGVAVRGPELLSTIWTNTGMLLLSGAVMQSSMIFDTSVCPTHLRQVERLFTEAIYWNKDNHLAHIGLGWVFYLKGRLDTAGRVWGQGGLTAQDLLGIGEQARQVGRYQEALAWYEQAAILAPKSGKPWYYMGLVFEQERKWAQALHALNQAIELEPELANSYISLANVLAFGYSQYEQAKAKADEGLRMAAGDAEILYQAAQFFLAVHDIERAEQLFRTAASIRPNNLYILIGLGQSLFAQERYDEAVEIFEQAEAIQTGDWQDAVAHVWLGRTYVKSGQLEEALREFEMAAQLHPADSDNFVRLGDAYQLIGEEDKALEAYRQALSVNPVNEWALKRISDLQKGE